MQWLLANSEQMQWQVLQLFCLQPSFAEPVVLHIAVRACSDQVEGSGLGSNLVDDVSYTSCL